MIYGLLACLVVVNVLYVFHLERKDWRHDEQVNRLLVHIQAPEVMVAQAQAPAPDLPAVNPMEDDDYWEAQQQALDELARREAELERLS